MSKKIFIVGRNRSGTKWLSNILANHNEIAAVQREGAGGILESNLLRNYPKHFDLNIPEERTAFEILFKESNFHRCSNIEGKILETCNYKSFYDFFESYMNELALAQKARFWLQKASSLELPVLIEKFPDAKFIIIQRKNVFDNVLSTVLLNHNKMGLLIVIKSLLDYWRHAKIEKNYLKHENVYKVLYEKLKMNPNSTVENICNFLDISFSEGLTKVSYKPNTSYKKKNKDEYYTKCNKFRINSLSLIVSLLPLILINGAVRFYNRVKVKSSLFQPLTFELYRNKNQKKKRNETSHTR